MYIPILHDIPNTHFFSHVHKQEFGAERKRLDIFFPGAGAERMLKY